MVAKFLVRRNLHSRGVRSVPLIWRFGFNDSTSNWLFSNKHIVRYNVWLDFFSLNSMKNERLSRNELPFPVSNLSQYQSS